MRCAGRRPALDLCRGSEVGPRRGVRARPRVAVEGAAPQPLVAAWDAVAPVGRDRVGLAVRREVAEAR